MLIDYWTGCYNGHWKGIITDESFQHPAKYSRNLIRRIYEHAFGESWLQQGDQVFDPFGGVALGALDAMRLGCLWMGVEIEPRFVEMGQANIRLWLERYGQKMPGWGAAFLVQGDSRNWLGGTTDEHRWTQILSSPPYADSLEKKGGIDPKKSQYKGGPHSQMNNSDTRYSQSKAVVSSPPFLASSGGTRSNGDAELDAVRSRQAAGNWAGEMYGQTPGQLGGMEIGSLDDVISSPPYADGCRHTGGDNAPGKLEGGEIRLPGLKGVVSSPPYAESDQNYKEGWARFHANHEPLWKNDSQREAQYGATAGQLGAVKGDTFWAAARQIVENCYRGLKPGGHALWVVKNYVKGGKIVPFVDQWRLMCESVGFTTLHEHRALLVGRQVTKYTLEGEPVLERKERKSFFRRLAEKNGSPRIDWECVLCMAKE